MFYKLLDKEVKFVESYQTTFADDSVFFVHLYQMWDKKTKIDEETRYVSIKLIKFILGQEVGANVDVNHSVSRLGQTDPSILIRDITGDIKRR